LPNSPWKTLRVKIIAWSFIPTAIILLAVALVAFDAYRRVAEDQVIGRNRELTRLSAGQLAYDLTEYSDLLVALARTADIHGSDPATQRDALNRARNRLVVFDAGVVVLDNHGMVVAAEPSRQEIVGQYWAERGYFRQLLRTTGPVFSDVVADGPRGADVVVVAVPITGNLGEFRGAILGMFRVGATSVSALYGGIVKLRIGENSTISLVDSNRRVVFHSDAERIGEELPAQGIAQELLDRKVGEYRFEDVDRDEVVASFSPVRGTPWVLLTEESWASMMKSSEGHRQFLMLLLVLGVVLPALVVTVGVSKITDPIARLIEGAKEVAGGRFGQTITVTTGDELEELAKQFNLMSAQLQESYSDLERKVEYRTRELAALNAIAAAVSRSLELDEVLNEALEKTTQTMGMQAAGIYLLDEGDGFLHLVAHKGFESQFAAGMDRMAVGEGFSGWVVATGQPLVVKDVAADPRLTRSVNSRQGLGSLVSVPLESKGEMLGALCVATPSLREFGKQDVQLLISIAHQVAVAIENARLYQQAQQLAVMEERNRLARDLHDSVTQAVYSVTLYAEAATRLLSAGQVEMATEHLRELRATSQQALKEMRSLIYELRPPVLEKEGLVAALHARLDAVEGRAGVKTQFLVEGDGTLPAGVERELYHIAQEALNNALKHAEAGSIKLRLRIDDRAAMMEIEDDGKGFDQAAAEECGGMGLRGMRERVASLGGILTVESRLGEGTRLRVEVHQ